MRIDHVNIERNCETSRSLRCDRHGILNTLCHAEFVDVAHGEEIISETEIQNFLPFAGVEVTSTNVCKIFRIQLRCETSKPHQRPASLTQKHRERHTVYVARSRRLGSVDISVCVEPDQTDLLSSLAK